MRKLSFLFVVFVLFVAGCIKPPDYPDEPRIEFESFSKTELTQNVDTTLLVFSFEDGDGDLGLMPNEPGTNVVVTDTRTNFQEFFRIPFIPQEGVENGISGKVNITLFATCCIPINAPACQPDPTHPPEELVYSIQIFDQAGNGSNIVNTPAITLICN